MKRLKILKFRRRREGKTDYKKRLKLLVSNKPRLVFRRSNNNIIIQIIEYEKKGDRVLLSTHSNELKKFGWKLHTSNLPSAYLTGLLCGLKANKKEIKEVVLDIGLYYSIKGSVLYSALNGLIDAGLKIPHTKEILPPKERISGKHISLYAEKLSKENPEHYKKQFSNYLKLNIKPEEIQKYFEEAKNNILKGVKNAKG